MKDQQPCLLTSSSKLCRMSSDGLIYGYPTVQPSMKCINGISPPNSPESRLIRCYMHSKNWAAPISLCWMIVVVSYYNTPAFQAILRMFSSTSSAPSFPHYLLLCCSFAWSTSESSSWGEYSWKDLVVICWWSLPCFWQWLQGCRWTRSHGPLAVVA